MPPTGTVDVDPDKLRALLAQRGLNPAQAARRAGYSRAAVSNIVNRIAKPSPALAAALATALGVERSELTVNGLGFTYDGPVGCPSYRAGLLVRVPT